MPVTWSVQPYAFLKELRKQYTRVLVLGTRNESAAMAAEAQQWMRQNAPWQDKDIYRGRGKNKKLIYPAGTARRGLVAFVREDESETQIYKELMAEAKNTDSLLLDQMNQDVKDRRELVKRTARFYKEEHVTIQRTSYGMSTVVTHPSRRAVRYYQNRLKSMQRYKTRSAVPKGRSAVSALEKRKAGIFGPVVEVVMQHNRDLRYAIWLEIANQGRYSIISKALDYWGPKFMARIKRISTLKQYQGTIALGEVVSPEEQFAENARQYEFVEGRPYEPFSEEVRQRSKVRKKYYKPEEVKRRVAENKQYLEYESGRATGKVKQDIAPATMDLSKIGRRG